MISSSFALETVLNILGKDASCVTADPDTFRFVSQDYLLNNAPMKRHEQKNKIRILCISSNR